MELVQKGSKRIEYIDALRGFTMILVVFGHVESTGFYSGEYYTPLWTSLALFRMPLFFFISGFIAFKMMRPTKELLLKKLRIQLIPMSFFGLIYTYLMADLNAYDFFSHTSKHGYWFTLSLLEMFLMYYFIHYSVFTFVKEKQRTIIWAFSLIGGAILLYVLGFLSTKFHIADAFWQISSMTLTAQYFCYFVFGLIASRFRTRFHQIIDSSSFITIILFVFFCCAYIKNTPHSFDSIYKVIGGFSGLLVVYSFFRKKSSLFMHDKPLGVLLQYIGKRTLDIYLLHFFFIPTLPSLGLLFKNPLNIALEFVVVFILSLVIICICLLLSNIIRLSPFLGKWLFGVRTNP